MRFIISLLLLISTSVVADERFKPPGCEYSVEFPDEPSIYKLQKATADGSTIPLHGAQLTVSSGNALIRAECASSGRYDMSQFTDENMNSYMEQLALDNGLSRSGFKVENSSLGKVGELTGVKNSERGRMTVRITNYIGSRSILTVYIASLSKDFQTLEMREFSKSVERY